MLRDGYAKFCRIDRLPPYVFAIVDELKLKARRAGEDIIDFGMGIPMPRPPSRSLISSAKRPISRIIIAILPRGIKRLRLGIADYYRRHFNVELDYDSEVMTTIGVKEGFSHLMWAIVNPGDLVLVPTPAYPIHTYGPIFANGNVVHRLLSLPSNCCMNCSRPVNGSGHVPRRWC